MENLNITLPNSESMESPETSRLLVYKGTAPEIEKPKPINSENGWIQNPANFAEHFKDVLPVDLGHAIFTDSSITFKCPVNHHNELHHPHCHSINGTLQPNPELAKFRINEAKTFNSTELTKLLRFQKRFFADADVNFSLVAKVQTLKAKVIKEIEFSDDRKGNKSASIEQNLEGVEMPTFALNLPLFKGFNAKKFMVEVCMDVSENQVIFWLESVELSELMETEKKNILNQQRDRFATMQILVLNS